MKEKIVQVEFNKRVDMESAYLIYMDRLPKEIAEKKALDFVSKKYEVKVS